MIDASLAFVLVLTLVQMGLTWVWLVTGTTSGMHLTAGEELELITASDRLIGDPKCLALVENGHVVAQTIDTTKVGDEAEYCRHDYAIINRELGGGTGLVPPPGSSTGTLGSHGGLRRLVFLDREGGEVGVLSVW